MEMVTDPKYLEHMKRIASPLQAANIELKMDYDPLSAMHFEKSNRFIKAQSRNLYMRKLEAAMESSVNTEVKEMYRVLLEQYKENIEKDNDNSFDEENTSGGDDREDTNDEDNPNRSSSEDPEIKPPSSQSGKEICEEDLLEKEKNEGDDDEEDSEETTLITHTNRLERQRGSSTVKGIIDTQNKTTEPLKDNNDENSKTDADLTQEMTDVDATSVGGSSVI